MSYDYWLYSPSEQPVRKEDLKDKLESQGWALVFCSISDCTMGFEISQIVSPIGPIENSVAIISCPIDHENLTCLLEAISRNEIQELNKILDYGGIEGVDFCGVWWSPFDVKLKYTSEELEALAKNYGDDYIAALQQTRTQYAFEISYVYDEFFQSVARAIANSVGGMIQDPQEGTIEFVPSRAK